MVSELGLLGLRKA